MPVPRQAAQDFNTKEQKELKQKNLSLLREQRPPLSEAVFAVRVTML